jgi:hypothetical protein
MSYRLAGFLQDVEVFICGSHHLNAHASGAQVVDITQKTGREPRLLAPHAYVASSG